MISHFFCKKKYISLILVICYIQYSSACNRIQYHDNSHILPILIDNNYYSTNQYTTIHAESDVVKIHYPQTIQLLGNVHVKYYNNTITSDTLTILNNYNNNTLCTTLYADSNVHFHNENIILNGSYAQFNLSNKNIDLHQGIYHFLKLHIYGTATLIMQRNNNRYTIMKNSNFTNCKCHDNYWHITGSEIFYDWNKNNIYIWNAYLKIKTIPIFYSPYLSFSLNQNNILESYIPNIGYHSKSGLILKVPFPLFFSKYYSGNIVPYYTSNFGTGLQTKINYLTTPNTGLVTINIVPHNNNNYHCNNRILYKLYWKHHSIIYNQWHLNIDYATDNYLIHYNSKKNNEKCFHNINNDINQKFSCYYNDIHWKINITYLGNSNSYKKNIIQNHCIYSVAPQLEIQFYSRPIWKKKIYFQVFNQLSQFIPSNCFYPKTTRIHIEPMINLTTNNYWGRFNIDARLKMTHYQQKKIDTYNTNQYTQYLLQNKINRIIPQFKTNGTMILQKKTNTTKSNKYFLESKLQYLYIPYTFQEHIGIYDTKIIYTNYNNLFHTVKYSGLDRIQSANQFKINITMRCFNKQSKKFSLSIGNTLNLNQNNDSINHIQNKKHYSHKSIINSNITLFSLGKGYWNINNYWNMHTEIQYDILNNKLFSENTILEYIGKKNQIFQSNYRYVNAQYFQKILFPINNLNYHKTISQLGIIIYYPLIKNWTINYSYYYNMKLKFFIDQSIGIQYSTPCYIFSAILERNITNWNDNLNIHSYENKIRFNFNLINFKLNFPLDSYEFFNSNMIPYQKLHKNVY